MEEDLEERLLGGRDMNAVSAVGGDDTRGLHRYEQQQQQRNGHYASPMGPQLRDMRKRKPSPDSTARRRTTASSSGGSGDELLSPRGGGAEAVPSNPFDDEVATAAAAGPTHSSTRSPASSIEQEAIAASARPPPQSNGISNGAQNGAAPPRARTAESSSPSTRPAGYDDDQSAAKTNKSSMKNRVAAPARVEEVDGNDGNGDANGDDYDAPGRQERNEARKVDEETLARVHLRMERLWGLEEDHATLIRRYARLEDAKKKTEAERSEWQEKHARQVEENEKMAATLKEWENKCAVLQQEKQESEVAAQKLNKKLDDERERYALLSSQFNELNAKMVEIINNVTNLKIDEIEQEKEARRGGTPLKKKPPPAAPAPPITQSAAAYFGFASPAKAATPTRPKAASLTPSKSRE